MKIRCELTAEAEWEIAEIMKILRDLGQSKSIELVDPTAQIRLSNVLPYKKNIKRRALDALSSIGVYTVGDLIECGWRKVAGLRNVGPSTLRYIERSMREIGIKLQVDD
jgi:hypothetical protein